MHEPILRRYGSIQEAVDAMSWLMKSRQYLFNHTNPNYFSFKDYLDWMKLCFHERLYVGSKEVDAGGPVDEDFQVVHLHEQRWKQKDRVSNTALLVYEIAEAYLQSSEFTFFSQYAHVAAEFFEGEFRLEKGLSSCPVCPLPAHIVPLLRGIELEFKEKIKSIQDKRGLEKLMDKNPVVQNYI